eukprot:TRINITY_DN17059_c0_g1_i1.p1 TRINITY_DN17059_c0_g1~~TRINITY_DN17059_c0_g1_i1.p1  ORF type:complete len:189 (-),score=38.37 TRINITY_DN17059_c0_g1_i1:207-743(-)
MSALDDEYFARKDTCHADCLEKCDYAKKARHISVKRVRELQQDMSKKLAFVDLRRPTEQEVSFVQGATLVSYTGTLADAEEKMRATDWSKNAELQNADYILCYCVAGWRGSVAAVVLSETFGDKVYNIAGGLIELYNDNEQVVTVDGNDTTVVNKFHPCAARYAQWITRENDFVLPPS